MRSFCLSILLLVAAAPAQAQVLQHYGVRLGGNVSYLALELEGTGDTHFASDRHVGFQVAGFAEVLDTPSFSVLAELEYARRGYAGEIPETSRETPEPVEPIRIARATTVLHYLSVPVLARLRLPGERAVVPYALAGPRVDLLVGRNPGRYEFSYGTFEDDTAEALAAFGVSGTVGLGAAFQSMLGREVRVEARYLFGLTDLLPEGKAVDASNRGIDFSVGIAL